MSAEAFDTFLTCDLRGAADGRGIEYAEYGTQHPRGFGQGEWISGYLRVEDVLKIASSTMRAEVMEGISGDFPEQREATAQILDAVGALVRTLALDAACDGHLTQQRWDEAVNTVHSAVILASTQAVR